MGHSSDRSDPSHSNQPAHETTTTTNAQTSSNINEAGPTIPMGYPPPYQPYPPPPQQYPYYYAYPPTGGGGSPSSSSFVRGFLAMMVAVIVVTCTASIVTWLVLRPQVPKFRLESLSVSGFDASFPRFAAEWEANVTAQNPNKKLRVYLERTKAYVYHKEDLLGSSGVEPSFLPTTSEEPMAVRVAANNTEDHSVGRWVVDDIAGERAAGAVAFNLRMMVSATFKSGDWWTKHASMKVLCEDLSVVFVGNETSGVLSPGQRSKQCVVYYA